MDIRVAILVGVLAVHGVQGVVCASSPADATDPAPNQDRDPVQDQVPDEVQQQGRAIFDRLVDRYRRLRDYEDTVAVVETVSRDSQKPHRVETRLACRIENDQLRIDSPSAQVRGGVGLPAPSARSNAMESLALRYNLWIAPHLALRFKEDPLAEFRLGVPQGFVVAGAETATWRDRELLKLTLKAAGEKDADADDAEAARYELWVNPDSMLVEHVTGRQTLPDGADYRITMDINPVRADGATVASGD